MRISDWSSDVCSSDLAVAGDDRIGDVVADFDGRAYRAARPGAVEPVADPDDAVFEAVWRCHRADNGCGVERIAARGAEQQHGCHASTQAAHQIGRAHV